MKNLVREGDFYKTFFRLTFAVAFQNVIVTSVNLADNVMLGSYHENALAGAALGNQIQFLLTMMVIGVGEGLLVLSSRFWGEKNIPMIKKTASIGLLAAALVTAILFFTVTLFPEWAVGLLTDDPEALLEGVKYIRVVAWSYPFFMITNVVIIMLRSVETVRIGMVMNLITLGVNVTLNYILIFGKLGFPEMGSRGAALATVISRAVETAVVLFYLFFMDKKLGMKPLDFFKPDPSLFKLYIKVGFPVFCSSFSWGIAQSFQTAILGHMGKAAINANSIAGTVFQVISVVVYASASASGVIIAKTIGEGKLEKIKPYAVTMQLLYLGLGLVSGACLFLIKDLIIGLYAVEGDARALAVAFMTVLSVTLVGTAYQMSCLTGIVRSGGDTKFVFYNDLIWMWVIVIPLAYCAAFFWNASPVVVFAILKCDQVTKCAVAAVKINRFKWVKKFR